MNQELSEVQAGFRKGRGTRDQIAKVSASNARDPGSIPGLGRSPGEGNGNPLQYSFPENPMDRGAWQATVHGVTKSQTRLSNFTSLHFTSLWIIEKAKEFQETSISALLTMPKPLTVWITRNCGKFFKRWEYQTT